MSAKIEEKIVWMPHHGHFIGGNWCRFKLNTYVNGFIISTVGEYVPYSEKKEFVEIGFGRKYETYVFHAQKSEHNCCPYELTDAQEIDGKGYNDAGDAREGHMELVEKYSKLEKAVS